jgi:DNA/RNA-binding domain of Phe-tRNA-synthetase-like protein
VDANNLVSLEHMVPISVWDVDLAQTERYSFRLGRPGEFYVFNQGGQVLEVEDLVVGCAIDQNSPEGRPIVTAIKDCLATKTRTDTARIAAAIYCPLSVIGPDAIDAISRELAGWLIDEKSGARASHRVLMPGRTITMVLD